MKLWFKQVILTVVCALHLCATTQAADIVIDPGHGGKDPGAIGFLGKQRFFEKDFALDMSMQLSKQMKKQGFSVAMTRTKDVFRSLPSRLAYGNQHCQKLFTSLHINSSKSTHASGVHTYVSRQADKSAIGKHSLEIARNVQKAFNPKDPIVRRAGFMMLKNTHCPSVQLEMYYMRNPNDLKKLSNPQQRHAIIVKLAKVLGKSLHQPFTLTKHNTATQRQQKQNNKHNTMIKQKIKQATNVISTEKAIHTMKKNYNTLRSKSDNKKKYLHL